MGVAYVPGALQEKLEPMLYLVVWPKAMNCYNSCYIGVIYRK